MFLILVIVEVESGALLRDVARPWKMILGGHGKVMEILFLGRGVETLKLRVASKFTVRIG